MNKSWSPNKTIKRNKMTFISDAYVRNMMKKPYHLFNVGYIINYDKNIVIVSPLTHRKIYNREIDELIILDCFANRAFKINFLRRLK